MKITKQKKYFKRRGMVKQLLSILATLYFVFAVSATLIARDPVLDLLLKKNILTEDEVASAEKAVKKPVTHKSESIEISGYIQPRYSAYDDEAGKDDQFSVKRARAKLKGYVASDWMFEMEYDFAAPKLIVANITFEAHPLANITMGQFKIPYAYAEIISSSKIDTIDRATAVGKLASDYDIGATLSGKVMDGLFQYDLAIINGAGMNVADDNDKKDYVARLAAYPFRGSEGKLAMMLAGAYWTGEQPNIVTSTDPVTGEEVQTDLGDQSRDRYIGTVEVKYDKAKVIAEYLHQELEDTDKTSDGYYVLATYDISLGKSIFQPVIMYDQYDPNNDKDDDEIKTTTLGFNFFPVKNVKLSLNYKSIDETPDKDNNEILAQGTIIF